MQVHIGTSGFTYNHWGGGVFYPEGLSRSKWLEYYTQYFKSVELNVTFYRLPSKETFIGWYKRTPYNFSFAVKGSRFITHRKKLHDVQEPLRNFFDRLMLLQKKLKIVLWQLPPSFDVNTDRLADFVSLLKSLNIADNVFEFRNESWFCEDVYTILQDAKMAICSADWPAIKKTVPIIADFVYLRRHGTGKAAYEGCYSDSALHHDAKKIMSWSQKEKKVFIYFNNDVLGYAVKNALTLSKMLQ